MKCPASILIRNGRKVQPIIVHLVKETVWFDQVVKPTDKLKKCDGTIQASVALEAEPYYGGCDTVLRIKYKCAKCGYPFNMPGKPRTVEDLQALVQEVIDKSDEVAEQ